MNNGLCSFFLAASLLASASSLAQAPTAVQTRPLGELAELAAGQASAEVLSPNDSLIAAELSATVAAVPVDVGAQVRRGQLLVELDATDARLALAQADAQVAAARANLAMADQRLARAKDLHQRQYASDDDLLARTTEQQGAKSELALREAARRIAARSVEKARILAPFDGVVLERQAQVGALAAPGTPLLRLVDLAAPEVQAALQIADAEGIAQAAELRFESQGRSWPLRLERLSPVADAASRTRLARFAFSDEAAPAGIAGLLRWRGPQRLLPPELLVRRGDQLGAFVAENGRARFVPAPGAQEGRAFALALPASALVVVQGQQGLIDGQALTMAPD
jgi:RND family efflux transporter MFP subunit